MPTKINCIHNDKGAWCKNKKVPRSLLGLGARYCSEFNNTKCSLLEPYKRPAPPPNPPLIPDGQAGWIVGQGMPSRDEVRKVRAKRVPKDEFQKAYREYMEAGGHSYDPWDLAWSWEDYRENPSNYSYLKI